MAAGAGVAHHTRLRVALVGAGAWGANLLRVLAAHPRVVVTSVVDPSPAALARACVAVPGVRGVARLEEALHPVGHDRPDAAVIASPSEHHAALALAAIEADLDVLVEKPIATSARDADAIVARARRRGRVAMVGHLMLHHPAVRALLDLTRRGAIGRPVQLVAARRSPPSARAASAATRRGDASALWALGPHDLSVLHALDDAPLVDAVARLEGAPGEQAPYRAEVRARLASGLEATIDLSRAHPFKHRRLLVVGDEGAALFDDMHPHEKLVVGGVPERNDPMSRLDHGPTAPRRVAHDETEPLAAEIDHFVRCVETRSPPTTPADDGATIVRWLERIEAAASG